MISRTAILRVWCHDTGVKLGEEDSSLINCQSCQAGQSEGESASLYVGVKYQTDNLVSE